MFLNLDIFNNLVNGAKDNKLIKNFIKELSNYLNETEGKEIDGLREEDCLYQVVDRSLKYEK